MEEKRNLPRPGVSRSQIVFNLLYSMVPLIGFWLVERYWGLEAGIVAAMGLALAELFWVYAREKRIEHFSLWSAVLVVLMGVVGWMMESDVVLRLKPAIFEGVFAALLLFSSAMKKPFMLVVARKQMGNAGLHPFQLDYLSGVNLRIGLLFLLHTLLTTYAAIFLSMDAWAFVSGAMFYILFFVFFAMEFFYSRFVFRKKMEESQRQQAFFEYQREIIRQVRQGEKKETPGAFERKDR